MSDTNKDVQKLQQRLDELAQLIQDMQMLVGSKGYIPGSIIKGAIGVVEKAEAEISVIESQINNIQ